MGMVSWKPHLRGKMLAQASQLEFQSGCFKGLPQIMRLVVLSIQFDVTVLFSFTAYHCPHLYVDFPSLLFLSHFCNINKVFFFPFKTENMAVVNLFFRTKSSETAESFKRLHCTSDRTGQQPICTVQQVASIISTSAQNFVALLCNSSKLHFRKKLEITNIILS